MAELQVVVVEGAVFSSIACHQGVTGATSWRMEWHLDMTDAESQQ